MFNLPDLPYEYNALEPFIDEETMHLHHDKHHATYVKNLNDALAANPDLAVMDIEDLLKDLDQVPDSVRTKVRNNGGGHANHSLFWSIMGPSSEKEPTGELAEAIKQSFGDFTQFKEKFAAAALGRFGSGWVWLVYDQGMLSIMDIPNQDSPLSEGKTPLLGLDVWEHAYYLKYQNRRAEYVDSWWNVVNWQEVTARYLATIDAQK